MNESSEVLFIYRSINSCCMDDIPRCILAVCSDVMEAVVGPLQEKTDDWRKTATALDKDHAKGDLLMSFIVINGSLTIIIIIVIIIII